MNCMGNAYVFQTSGRLVKGWSFKCRGAVSGMQAWPAKQIGAIRGPHQNFMHGVPTTRPIPGVRVRLDHIRRTFDANIIALDDLSLDVPPGQFLAILGPSGCGKSTLLRLVAGLDLPQAGTVHVESLPHAGQSARRRRIRAPISPMSFKTPICCRGELFYKTLHCRWN